MAEQEIKEPKLWQLFVILGLICAVWILCGWILPDSFFIGKETSFSSIDALFSGFAFAGVIYAILLQRAELRLQRDELAMTRAELHGQKEQMELQNATLKKQNFENTFFQLLKAHADLISSISVENGLYGRGSGRSCFQILYTILKEAYYMRLDRSQVDSHMLSIRAYENFYIEYQFQMGAYFRSLYNIIKFVDRAENIDRSFYTNIVRAYLSELEVAFLYYNCRTDRGAKFKPLVEKYALLKMLNDKYLLDGNDLRNFYSSSAYG